MNLCESLYAELSTWPAVTALAGTRGYPELIPQTVQLPAWAYSQDESEPELAHNGPTGLCSSGFQITCAGADYAQARALAGAIRARLLGFRGLLGGAGGVQVFYSMVSGDADGLAGEDGATVRLNVELYVKEN